MAEYLSRFQAIILGPLMIRCFVFYCCAGLPGQRTSPLTALMLSFCRGPMCPTRVAVEFDIPGSGYVIRPASPDDAKAMRMLLPGVRDTAVNLVAIDGRH